jgi:hypothetical protein
MMRLQPEVAAARARGGNLLYYSLYGDAIFSLLHCITRSHRPPIGGELNDREEEENFAMCCIRTLVEWPNKTATNLFYIFQSKYNNHLLGHNRTPNALIGQQLRVLFFFYDCYVCLNGSKFSRLFEVVPPTIEEYLRVYNFNNGFI